ncbi:MAG: DUF1963 domain-containing protein [Marinifilaceae bacterium]
MENTELKKKISEKMAVLEKYKRTAYLPVTKKVVPDFSSDSKIGGLPYLRNEEDWPVCPCCNKRMQLFLQLNLNDIPEKKEDKLIQVFYCVSEEPHCENEEGSYEAFSEAVICRKIDIADESAVVDVDMEQVFVESFITSWEAKDDYPQVEEFTDLGVEVEYDSVYEHMLENKIGVPLPGDKLFGWPDWIQGVEYPSDRNTDSQMEVLFQLESEENLPYMFGDMGIAHLTVSTDDENEMAFSWACY